MVNVGETIAALVNYASTDGTIKPGESRSTPNVNTPPELPLDNVEYTKEGQDITEGDATQDMVGSPTGDVETGDYNYEADNAVIK